MKSNRGLALGVGFLLLGLVISVVAQPSISSFTPTSGPPGTVITLKGTGFSATPQIKVGATPAVLVRSTDTLAVAMVMPGLSGSVTVTTASGNTTSANAFSVTPLVKTAYAQRWYRDSLANGGRFLGYPIAVSADGIRMIIGSGFGWPSVYRIRPTGFEFEATLIGQGNANFFGNSQSLQSASFSADGRVVMIGSANDSFYVGAVWAFERRSDNTWVPQGGKIIPREASLGAFGYALALSADGKTAIIGAPSSGATSTGSLGGIDIYKYDGTTWNFEAATVRTFTDATTRSLGLSVAISADGNTIAAGAPSLSPYGAAWVYTREGNVWVDAAGMLGNGAFNAIPKPPFGEPLYLGAAVALSADGKTLAIGGGGAVGIVDQEGGGWYPKQYLFAPGAGYNADGYVSKFISISADGLTVFVGCLAVNRSRIRVFRRSSRTELFKEDAFSILPNTGNVNNIGDRVETSASGERIFSSGYTPELWGFEQAPLPSSAPKSVRNLAVIDRAFQTFTVKWDPPIGGVRPNVYRLEVTLASNAFKNGVFLDTLTGITNKLVGIELFDTTTTSMKFKYVVLDSTEFKVRVLAINAAGQAISDTVNFYTVPAPPEPPIYDGFTILSTVTHNSFRLDWSRSPTGRAPDGYIIEVATSNFENTQGTPPGGFLNASGQPGQSSGILVDKSQNSILIQGLQSLKGYHYMIRTYNEGGVSSRARINGFNTKADLPPKPSVSITSLGSQNATITISGLLQYFYYDNGLKIYVELSKAADNLNPGSFISQQGGRNNAMGFIVPRTNPTTGVYNTDVSISGLEPATSYMARIRGENDRGSGPFSDIIRFKTSGVITSVPEDSLVKEPEFLVYPTLVSDILYIKPKFRNRSIVLRVLDSSGNQVSSSTITTAVYQNGVASIDFTSFSRGVYFISLLRDDSSYCVKVLKK